jgi:hypothetical protein
MNLATESSDTRRDAFAIAGERRGLLPIVVEKDFWVCWTLERLFALPDLGPHLLFKGGTSLSKVYGLIRRFSEDIDLSLSRTALGDGLADPERAASNTQRKLRTEALVAAFQETVTGRLLPALREAIAQQLGQERQPGDGGWTLTQDGTDPGTLHFAYPRATEGELSYIRPEVKIELGGRSDDWPAEDRTVTAYAAEVLPQMTPGAVAVRALAARRTFWEKATILHAEHHRPQDKPTGERLSRHYSDLAQMAGTEAEAQALGDLALLARVREHKAAFYTAPWASYDTARPGTLRLAPRPERLAGLRTDYRGMAAMFFGPVLPFDDMMGRIAALEERVNTPSK